MLQISKQNLNSNFYTNNSIAPIIILGKYFHMPEMYIYNKNDLVIFFGDLIYIESLIILAIFKNKITICLSYFILSLINKK